MKSIWLNLPVKNLQKSKSFFTAIGFRENPIHANADHLSSFLIGEHDFVLMLFPEKEIGKWLPNTITDTSTSNELLINIDADSTQEIDAFAQTVEKAGGTVYERPQWVEGWMYLCSFTDLDGHCWNVLYMDMDKMPKG